MPEQMTINGHEIPGQLQDAIVDGSWMQLASSDRLSEVFGESYTGRPSFYDAAALNLENQAWPDEDDPMYLGDGDSGIFPGDIDPAQSVIIADLGHDRLIALDYRSAGGPRVVYLADNWVEIAPNVEVLVAMLASTGMSDDAPTGDRGSGL